MKALFWCSVAAIAYTYFGYPLYIWARSLVAPHPWKQAEIYPTVTVIMAVHNGAALICEKIEHLLALDYPADRYDVLVVSDGSSDGTNEILSAIQHPRLRSIVCPDHVGKAVAINRAMRVASGEVLLFVDIRPRLEPNALRQLLTNFADQSVGCATGELILSHDGQDASTRAVGGLYWRYEQWIRNCEARVDSPLGVYGGFYAIRRDLATEFPDGTILDDMFEPLSIIRRGYRSVLDESAIVRDAWPPTATGEFNRKVRTLAGNFQLLKLAPWLLSAENRLRVQFVSHKLLRLTVPVLLLTTFLTSLLLSADSLYFLLTLAQAAFYCVSFAGLKSRQLARVSGPGTAFIMLNAAVVVGFYRFLVHGDDLWKTWVQPTGRPSSVAAAAR